MVAGDNMSNDEVLRDGKYFQIKKGESRVYFFDKNTERPLTIGDVFHILEEQKEQLNK